MPRILVSPQLIHHTRGTYCDILEKAGHEVVWPSVRESQLVGDVLIEHLQGISGVLAGGEVYSRAVLEATNLRAIARAGVGYDSVDVAAASERGIAVTITPGTNEHSVAEHTLALLFAVYRGVIGRDAEVRSGNWKRQPLWRLSGKTLGLVGLGRIGRALAPRARGLGLKLIAYDPYPNREFAAEQGVTLVSLDELFAQSDIVSLHLPATPETRDLINRKTLAQMRRGAVLLNAARGDLVDENALAEALASGHLRGAGLDVFKVEPLPLDSPLVKLDNVVLAPHMGGQDEESAEAMFCMAADCLVRLSHNEWPVGCVVNDQLRAGWKW